MIDDSLDSRLAIILNKHTLQILQHTGMWKNVHPVYDAGIRTHDLWNMSLLTITTRPGLPIFVFDSSL